ncbi:MAG: tRNA 2-thiocytidine biosynthesis protein TtcA [Desulfobulbaceae bacterium]|uniref:tRNA 2-thiocytidine biosynthesis protein TtcA n=1 Tax=Candidatus Desulfatifera sulfidica TaxID=2841691 RepID=A0A8J6NA43_9BACT|nr:tRNA 2-thiocytidine biosynthesis protein TtcA [Candidatus Desulfatifera sulfidica]
MTGKILDPTVNRRIGRAMHDHAMLAEGDRVLVAVSGGVDSLVLAWLLDYWRAKAPIFYALRMVHVDMGFSESVDELAGQVTPVSWVRRELARVGLEMEAVRGRRLGGKDKESCFLCARNRRQQLFELAREWKCNKIAFGHHQDDLIETLFLNMFYSGNISTMIPRQDLFAGRLTLIRPLAYIIKAEIEKIANRLGFQCLVNPCPLAGRTRREQVRGWLDEIYEQEPSARSSIFTAMGNVRQEYLL